MAKGTSSQVLFLAAGLSFLLAACTSSPVDPAANQPSESSDSAQTKDRLSEAEAAIVATKEEIAIGRTMASKMLGTFGYYEKDEKLQVYIRQVGSSLAKEFGRPELKFHFAVIDDKAPNAFATPGGYIFVTHGLLKLLKDESELAAVLAHELVHVNHKHMYMKVRAKKEVSTGETIGRILSRGAGDIGKSLSQAVTAGMKTLLEEGLTQANEIDADTTGVIYMSSLGYDPSAMNRVLDRLAKMKGKSVFHKTHPPFDARIKSIEDLIKAEGLNSELKLNAGILQKRFASAIRGPK